MSRPRLAPLVVATGASQALLVFLAPTMVAIAHDLHTSVGAIGQARSVTAVAAIIGSIVVTPRIDAVGVPRLILAGAGLGVLACVGIGLAPTLLVFLSVHTLLGLALACLLSAGFAGVAAFEDGRRARAMGYVAAANALAWILVNPVVGLVTDAASWRLSLVVPGAAALSALALAPSASTPRTSPVPARMRTVLTSPRARRWIVSELVAYGAWTAFLTFNGAFLIEALGARERTVGWLLAIGPAAYAFAATRSAGLASWLPRQRIVALAAATVAALLALLLGFAGSLLVAAGLSVLIGLAGGVRTPTSSALGLDQLPDHPGAIMAARTAVTQLGYLVGGLAGGLVVGGWGYPALGLTLGVGMVASAVLVLRVRPDAEAEDVAQPLRRQRPDRLSSPA